MLPEKFSAKTIAAIGKLNAVRHRKCRKSSYGQAETMFHGHSGCVTGNSEGAAKLAANPAGEEPASRTCPVATVVIPDGGESDLSCRKLRSKSPSRQSVSSVGSVKGASKSAGCSERSEPLAAKSRSHW
jgi:hypothetical protein